MVGATLSYMLTEQTGMVIVARMNGERTSYRGFKMDTSGHDLSKGLTFSDERWE